MPKKKISNQQKAFRFYDSARGHLILVIIIWFIGFNLLLLAIDTGSLLQWSGVFVSFLWGMHHLVQSIKLCIQKTWNKSKKA